MFLGGASQGCTMALDVYLRLACELQLGGFVGSIGFVPTDSKGFRGTNRALRQLLADKEQAALVTGNIPKHTQNMFLICWL